LVWGCGFGGGWTDLASLAKKNFESAVVGPGLFAFPPSSIAGLNVTVCLFGISLSSAPNPSPDPFNVASPAILGNSFAARIGVPFGVPVGVECVLSTLTFLDPDLGVMLLFKNAETGVDSSSLEGPTGGVPIISERAPRRDKGVEAVCGAEPATLGVNGVLFAVFAAEALRVGMRGRFCLSYEGMLFAALPLFAVNGAFRSRALWSRDCNGGLNGGRDGRGRVGVFSGLLLLSRLLFLSDMKVARIFAGF
jgi:hypothetical protein